MPSAARLRAAALAVLALTLTLVGLGGVVHSTGSSLACPDWPLCRGEVMPRMEGGVLYEHSHRLLALAVLAGILSLPWLASRASRAVRRITRTAAALVVAQALLGALTVVLLLPPIVSIAHLAVATLLVGLLTWVATVGERPHLDRPPWAFVIPLALVFLQVVLGAAVRHLGASTACGRDLIGCGGAALPLHPWGWLHFAHRGLGLVALASLLWAGARALRTSRGAFRRAGALLVAGGLAQVALGFTTVALGPDPALVTTHLVVGELLVAGLVFLVARAAIRSSSAATESMSELNERASRPLFSTDRNGRLVDRHRV